MARGPAFSPTKKFGRDIANARLFPDGTDFDRASGWIAVGGLRPLHIVVSGLFTNVTIAIHVSNDPVEPTAAVTTYPTWSDLITAPASILIDAPIQWLNARVFGFSGGSGTVFVDLMGG
jgi:hypothetical protein